MIDASHGVVINEEQLSVDSTSFQKFEIKPLKIMITFKLQLEDLNSQRQSFPILSLLKHFASQLASVTDFEIKFTQI